MPSDAQTTWAPLALQYTVWLRSKGLQPFICISQHHNGMPNKFLTLYKCYVLSNMMGMKEIMQPSLNNNNTMIMLHKCNATFWYKAWNITLGSATMVSNHHFLQHPSFSFPTWSFMVACCNTCCMFPLGGSIVSWPVKYPCSQSVLSHHNNGIAGFDTGPFQDIL